MNASVVGHLTIDGKRRPNADRNRTTGSDPSELGNLAADPTTSWNPVTVVLLSPQFHAVERQHRKSDVEVPKRVRFHSDFYQNSVQTQEAPDTDGVCAVARRIFLFRWRSLRPAQYRPCCFIILHRLSGLKSLKRAENARCKRRTISIWLLLLGFHALF